MLRTSALSLIILLTLCSSVALGQALSASTVQTNISCNGQSDGTASVTVSGGTAPYSYSWSPSGGTSATATDLSADTYACTITDANGTITVATVTITEPSALSTTYTLSNACSGSTNGSATVAVSGGTAPYTYLWSPDGGTDATATGLAPYGYVCYITDANGCNTTEKILIEEAEPLSTTYTQTDVKCNGGSDGSATVVVSGGTAPYNYSWYPSGGTDATATGLPAYGYICTVTDANGCNTTEKILISEPAALVTSSTQTDVKCNGGSDGSATVDVTGGTGVYTYAWYPSGGTDATATGLSAIDYTCVITDENSCIVSATLPINEPAALSAIITKTDVTTPGGTDGTATVTVSGGVGPYTYSWSPDGGMDVTAINLSPGDYTVEVKDNNKCLIYDIVTIDDAAAPDMAAATAPEEETVVPYPNPVTESFTVLNAPANAVIKVTNMDGNVLISTTDTVIDISSLLTGMYMLVVESPEGNHYTKFMKQ